MASSRQNKNRNSRRTPTATSTKRNFTGSMLLVTSINTPSTASATPVQQASHVDQISDWPTLPNKNNASLKEQLKQQQLLINKLTSCINALESHVELLEGKIAIQETVSNLLQQNRQNRSLLQKTMPNSIRNSETKERVAGEYQNISSWKSPENWSTPKRNRQEHWQTSSGWKIWSWNSNATNNCKV